MFGPHYLKRREEDVVVRFTDKRSLRIYLSMRCVFAVSSQSRRAMLRGGFVRGQNCPQSVLNTSSCSSPAWDDHQPHVWRPLQRLQRLLLLLTPIKSCDGSTVAVFVRLNNMCTSAVARTLCTCVCMHCCYPPRAPKGSAVSRQIANSSTYAIGHFLGRGRGYTQ